MKNIISPTAMLDIISKVEQAIWDKFSSYKNVKRYIERWHDYYCDDDGMIHGENFAIVMKEDSNIDLSATLDNMDDELLFQVAVDLGVEVPGLIYSVAEIKGVLASKHENAAQTFEKAHGKIYSDPATAILMANSALELIIKNICKDPRLNSCKKKDTLYKLASHILKEFNLFPDPKLDANIKQIGSGLLSVSQAIENIRSNNTEAHGTEDEIISDPLYAMLIVNAVTTIGLFLMNYYEKNYNEQPIDFEDDLPF